MIDDLFRAQTKKNGKLCRPSQARALRVCLCLLLTGAALSCGVPTTTPEAADTPTPQPVLFLPDIHDGDTLEAHIDARSGFPVISTQVEIKRTGTPMLALDADGLQVALQVLTDRSAQKSATLDWTPWHGNGSYQLDVLLGTQDSVIARHSLTVQVAGIPDSTPTIAERFIQLYDELWGVTLTAPAFAHHSAEWESSAATENRWVSVAYIGNHVYTIYLFDDGRIENRAGSIATADLPVGGCWPAGTYRILTTIVDYDNTQLDPDTVQTEIENAASTANQHWADHAIAVGLAEPILQIETTTIYVGAPPTPGQFLKQDQIEVLTGHSPSEFDLLAEVDMDAQARTIQQYIPGAGGLSFFDWCQPTHPQGANMSMAVDGLSALSYAGGALYEHELLHMMGWMHEWPCGDGSSESQFEDARCLPALLFGWTDTDGDGVVEILDDTPYGLVP